MTMGIYYITNVENGMQYVGESTNIENRVKIHLKQLRGNRHSNPGLQKDFNEYGENAFVFLLLEECGKDDLIDREIFWTEAMDTFENGYNISKGGLGHLGRKMNDEFRKRMREVTKGQLNGNYGHRWTLEMRQRMSQQRLGIYAGKNNPRAQKVIRVETLEVFDTEEEAAENDGTITSASISHALTHKKYLAGKYHYALYTKETYEYLCENKFDYLISCYACNKIPKYYCRNTQEFLTKTELIKKISSESNFTQRQVAKYLQENLEITHNGNTYISTSRYI